MKYINKYFIKNKIKIFKIKISICILLCFIIFYLYIIKNGKIYDLIHDSKGKIYYDKYDIDKYNEIKNKLNETRCSQMFSNHREFLNGIIRKFKPHKILEIGVQYGGSSIIILNAINDIKNSKLYSIDLNSEQKVGECVYKYFPQFLENWNLFKGNIATEFLEQIGNNIDMVFIDTAHFEPGEILDFLIALPFLKEEAIVIFHDIAHQITTGFQRNEWAPYIIFNEIRGEKYLPSGNYILKHDIGAIKLEKNQKNYYNDYFRCLGGQWQYFPKEIYINQIRKYIKKYYDEECLMIFEESVSFNRILVKKQPKMQFYRYNSD